jgi:EmrB/QacA subfamily drug resistance transporter
MNAPSDLRRRWLALIVLCLGVLMIVLDTTIVNVALPSIRDDLHFTETSLVWVVNAYLLPYAGFLLLAGRLGDLYGHRRLFLIGLAVFTVASIGCGLAHSQVLLIAARAIQGLGGAVVGSVALSLITTLFPEPGDRAKAMGIYGFVCAGGGSIGVLLGGILTSALSWHWIFLVNLPLGIAVTLLCLVLLPPTPSLTEKPRLDIAGAITVTASLMLAVYLIIDGNRAGWISPQSILLLLAAISLLVLFLFIESRIANPLVPLRMFRLRNVVTANLVGMMWASAMFAWFFISALYLQTILGYHPLQVGLAYIPTNVIMALFSIGLSARLVMHFGIRIPLIAGLLMIACGLTLFARAPVSGTYLANVFPSMLLLGLGAGIALNPVLLAAMSDVDQHEAGLASGIVNTAFMMGGALGLATLASLASARTQALSSTGMNHIGALNKGYQIAFALGAVFAFMAAATAALFLRLGKGVVLAAPRNQ